MVNIVHQDKTQLLDIILSIKLFLESHMSGKRAPMSQDVSPATVLEEIKHTPASHPWLKSTLSTSSYKAFEHTTFNFTHTHSSKPTFQTHW